MTGSVDSTDIYGVADFAIGHFAAGEDILGGLEAIKGEWNHLARTYDQSRWAYVFDPGLIDMDEADNLAGQVWKEEEDQDDLSLAS